jgi:hypothetical protein
MHFRLVSDGLRFLNRGRDLGVCDGAAVDVAIHRDRLGAAAVDLHLLARPAETNVTGSLSFHLSIASPDKIRYQIRTGNYAWMLCSEDIPVRQGSGPAPARAGVLCHHLGRFQGISSERVCISRRQSSVATMGGVSDAGQQFALTAGLCGT